jgi:hypothetical protein
VIWLAIGRPGGNGPGGHERSREHQAEKEATFATLGQNPHRAHSQLNAVISTRTVALPSHVFRNGLSTREFFLRKCVSIAMKISAIGF